MTVAAARIEPAMRFDNTAFSNEVEDGYALSIYAKYTCPRCRAVVGFSKADFEERGPLRRSNLAEPIAAAMDTWAAANGLGSRPFLDWECPGCGLAVRAYSEPWAGGRHGDRGTNIVAVLEMPPGDQDDR